MHLLVKLSNVYLRNVQVTRLFYNTGGMHVTCVMAAEVYSQVH